MRTLAFMIALETFKSIFFMICISIEVRLSKRVGKKHVVFSLLWPPEL